MSFDLKLKSVALPNFHSWGGACSTNPVFSMIMTFSKYTYLQQSIKKLNVIINSKVTMYTEQKPCTSLLNHGKMPFPEVLTSYFFLGKLYKEMIRAHQVLKLYPKKSAVISSPQILMPVSFIVIFVQVTMPECSASPQTLTIPRDGLLRNAC